METCKQSPTETVWQHCQNVSRFYFQLLANPEDYLPEILLNKWEFVRQHQMSSGIVRQYLEWHDCGKPYCQSVNAEGKTQFPNHAAISERIFLEAGGDTVSAKLIGLDMLFHTTKLTDILALNLDCETLCTLMLSAWAAIYANAEMFGGLESESFKIKRSQLTARCKKILHEIC